MKSIFMHGNFYDEGTPAEINFENRRTVGTLYDSNSDKRTVGIKDGDGRVHWAHETFVRVVHKRIRWQKAV